MNTILESLSNIAMISKETLMSVQNVVVEVIRTFGVEGAMSVDRWAKRLDGQFIVYHQPQRNVEEAHMFICRMVA